MTENLRIAILKLYTTQEIKDLLLSRCDIIDHEVALKDKEIANLEKQLADLRHGEYYTHDDKPEYTETETERLQRTGDGGDDEGFKEFCNQIKNK